MNEVASVPHSRERLDSVALAAGFVAPLTWGMTGVFVRLLHGVPTLAIVDVRLLIAALALSPWAFRRRHAFRDALRSPLGAAMGAYYIFATEAFARAPVVEVTLLVGCAPVIAVGLEYARGRRPIRQQSVGAVTAVLGLLLFLHPSASMGRQRWVGDAFALGAAAVSAAYAVGLRARAQSQRPLDPLVLTVSACLVGALASLALLGGSGQLSALTIPPAAESTLLALLGAVSTAVPTLAFGVASARLPSVLVTSLGLMTPLFAAVFAGMFLKEWPDIAALPGALLTIAGVVIVLRTPR
jgi:drug/metabolite transporter (DMT)-like permease